MTGPCRTISCNKRTTLQGTLIIDDAMHVWRQGVYRNSLYIPLNFAVNLKLLYKNKVLKICEEKKQCYRIQKAVKRSSG